jgi:hypothetical protein
MTNKIKKINKSIYRKLLMLAGALHIVFFFLLPYGKTYDLLDQLGDLASLLGQDSGVPKYLTGFSAIRLMFSLKLGSVAGLGIFLYAIIIIFALSVILMSYYGTKRPSYAGCITLSALALPVYMIVLTMLTLLDTYYQPFIFTKILVIIFTLAQLILSIVGCVLDNGTVSNTASSYHSAGSNGSTSGNKSSKGHKAVPKKDDGILRGITGAYAGAEIPIPAGVATVIGRDPDSCNVVIKGENVSRRHCSVSYLPESGVYRVTDFSVNGVFDGTGKRLPAKTAVTMFEGSELHIGNDVFRLE